MNTRPFIVILSGEPGCGKTIICSRVVTRARAQNMEVAGILTLPRYVAGCKVGLDVVDIRTGQRRSLAERYRTTDGPHTKNWHFHADSLDWGTTVLCCAAPCDLLVIDELGPLELTRDQGWTVGLDLLRAGRYHLALVVVRSALLPHVRERLEGIKLLMLVVTGVNRDDVPGEILTLLEPEEVC